MSENVRAIALDTFAASLKKMKPEKLVYNALKLEGDYLRVRDSVFNLGEGQKIWVLGAGKASARMAVGLEQALGNRIRDGIVIAPKGATPVTRRIQIFPGSHPLPDEYSLASTLELMDLADSIPDGATVFFLMSGGASALMELPDGRISLDDIRITYDAILKSGASIHEMNLIRKHLSAVKGGKLLKRLAGKKVINLILSDVPGDDPRHIGSGPTNPEPSTKQEAAAVIEKYGLQGKIPPMVMVHLRRTIEQNESIDAEYHNFLLGTSRIFADTVAEQLHQHGYETAVLPEAYDLPVEEVVTQIVQETAKKKSGKHALLYHGESTVKVTGSGKGGRNQHLALLAAQKLAGVDGVFLLSAGTDGRDGPTDAAGALVDGSTFQKAQAQGMETDKYLTAFDAYHFFKSLDALIFTGSTGNNLMDFQMVLIDR